MRIFDNYGRSNGKTMELACQIAEYIKGKGTVVITPIEELIEEVTNHEKKAIREFAEWLLHHSMLCDSFGQDVNDYDLSSEDEIINEVLAEYEKEQK